MTKRFSLVTPRTFKIGLVPITDIIQEPLLTSRTLKQDEINCGLFLEQRPLAMLKIPDAEEKSFN